MEYVEGFNQESYQIVVSDEQTLNPKEPNRQSGYTIDAFFKAGEQAEEMGCTIDGSREGNKLQFQILTTAHEQYPTLDVQLEKTNYLATVSFTGSNGATAKLSMGKGTKCLEQMVRKIMSFLEKPVVVNTKSRRVRLPRDIMDEFEDNPHAFEGYSSRELSNLMDGKSVQ